MRLYAPAERGILEMWALEFPPAGIVLCGLETGEEIPETSLVVHIET